jgi:hypothetical protein
MSVKSVWQLRFTKGRDSHDTAKLRPVECHFIDPGEAGKIPPFEDFVTLSERLTGRNATAEERAQARREYDEWVREVSTKDGNSSKPRLD